MHSMAAPFRAGPHGVQSERSRRFARMVDVVARGPPRWTVCFDEDALCISEKVEEHSFIYSHINLIGCNTWGFAFHFRIMA